MLIKPSLLMFLFVFCIILSFMPGDNFKNLHLKNERVKLAYTEKYDTVKAQLTQKGVDLNSLELYIQIFKYEQIIELWIKNKTDIQFKFFKSFSFCAMSGDLGPKRKQGDRQTPEGFYFINMFNPTSNFFLSLGINYPNESDKILGDKNNPGGNIFIHGNCVTIGCIPITDEKIKELYLIALEARNNGQLKIPVFIFPIRLTEENFNLLIKEYSGNHDNINLWNDLKTAFDYFDNKKILPKISFLANGRHKIE